MKSIASLVVAITLPPLKFSTSNRLTSASLRGTSSSDTRNLQVPPNGICYTHFGDDPFAFQTDCSQGWTGYCEPFDPSKCAPGADDDAVVYPLAVPCLTFVVWPATGGACKWAYACC
jgi:hypothetical protein